MIKRTLQRLVDVRDSELRVLLWACAYFFCVLTCYSILRPLRDEISAGAGREELPWLFTYTLIGTLLANPVYAALVTRYPRKKFIPIAYHFGALNLLAFYLLLRFLPSESAASVARVFFVWLSVVNMFAISIFWSFMADVFLWEQSKRLFGLIAVGGSLGAIAGSGITALLAKPLGPVNLFLVAIAFLELALVAVSALVKLRGFHDDRAPERPEANVNVEAAEQGGVLNGLRLVFRSPYLQGICLYLLFYTVSSTFLYFGQSTIVRDAVKDSAERTALFARMDFAVNVISIGIQIFFTGRIVKTFGVGFALVSQPLLAMIAFACVGWSPALAVIVVAQVALRSANFATAKPARETLYTVVGREAKYKSKSFIDTFVYRGGDAAGGWIYEILDKKLGLGLSQIAFIGVPIAAGWMLVGLLLGRKQERLAIARGEATAAADLSAPLR